jgi:hypothetical protein
MQQQKGSYPPTPYTPNTPDTFNTAMHAKKHSYAKHGYKPSTGNVTIVSVSLQPVGSRSTSRKSSFESSFEESGLGKSVSRQQSMKSVKEERRGRRGTVGQRRRENEDEGGIVVQTSYHVQSAREDV